MRYQIDDQTFDHLTAYCERETRTEDEALELREKILGYLEACEPDEAEYSLSHGWRHLSDLVA